ncbi:MAG: holo-ACP synthase [Rickettsiaceae bacterium]|nr:holo-ACP synthase [Rickettsiaceae bacterium]
MIVGIGVDLINKNRIADILSKYNSKFVEKILGDAELEIYGNLSQNHHVNYLSKRFAAKEALSKALGTGIGKFVQFNNINILNDSSGKPYLKNFNSSTLAIDIAKVKISISDEKDMAIAFVVVYE